MNQIRCLDEVQCEVREFSVETNYFLVDCPNQCDAKWYVEKEERETGGGGGGGGGGREGEGEGKGEGEREGKGGGGRGEVGRGMG